MAVPKMDLTCTTCSNESNNMKPIFKDDICRKFIFCFGLNIKEEDLIPSNICTICLDKIYIAYEFRQRCETSHNTFINIMSGQPREDAKIILANNGGNFRENMNLVCCTCLNESRNMISIFMADGDSLLYKMLQSCSGLNFHAIDKYPTNICSDCLSKLRISYNFQKQCEIMLNFMGTTIIEKCNIGVGNGSLQKTIEMDTTDKVSVLYKCSRCLIQYTMLAQLEEHFNTDHPDLEIVNRLQNVTVQTDKILDVGVIYKCSLCSNQYKILTKLEEHFFSDHPDDASEINLENMALINRKCSSDVSEKVNSPNTLDLKMECEEGPYMISEVPFENIKVTPGNPGNVEESRIEIDEPVASDYSDYSPSNGKYNATSVNVHIQQNSKNKEICKICQTIFTTKKDLNTHLHNKHQANVLVYPHQCDQCNAKFPTKYGLKRHKATHLNEKLFPCNKCDKSFGRSYHRTRHMLTHSITKAHECKPCNITFVQLDSLRRHRQRIHGEQKRFNVVRGRNEICKICQKAFTTGGNLQRHMKTSHLAVKEGPFLCSECGSQYNCHYELVYHIRRRHKGETPYKCKVCHKGFPRGVELRSHELTHNKHRTRLCPLCNKGLTSTSNLRSHIRSVHPGERAFKCSRCDKSFIHDYGLKVHIWLHDGKLLKCKICGESIEGNLLTEHKRNLHGIVSKTVMPQINKFVIWFASLATNSNGMPLQGNYLCRVCDKRFFTNRDLQYHLKVHEYERPHKCPHCDKSYNIRGKLTNHILTHTRTKKLAN